MIAALADLRVSTERLVLRPIAPDDAGAVFALFANWNVTRFLCAPPWPYARSDADEWTAIVSQPDDSGAAESAFAICRDNALAGVIGARLRPASDLQRGAGPNIGYWLGEPHWGRGYMTEAACGLLAAVFQRLGSDMIYSGAFTDNTASLRVQEKLGFARAGETMLFSRPRGADFPHANTVLTKARFEAQNP
jgi:RimJ/RimL family protein N-acetyltransferase